MAAGFAALLFALFAQQGLAGEADLVALDGEDLHENLVSELELVADVADALLGDLADVQQPICAGEQLDERASLQAFRPMGPGNSAMGYERIEENLAAVGASIRRIR